MSSTLLGSRLLNALQEFCKDNKVELDELREIPAGASLVNYFCRNWYIPTTFVFRKNIKVTNVQFTELLSLVRSGTTYLDVKKNLDGSTIDKDICARVYEKSKRMKAIFSSLWDSQTLPKLDDTQRSDHETGADSDEPARRSERRRSVTAFVDEFSKRYSTLFSDTILVDTYAGSAQIHVSPAITLDYEKICAESGYIYSCGYTIYMRRSTKVTVSKLREKIAQWLKNVHRDASISFVIYSKEQFPTGNNPDVVRAELNGLDDLKFHLDKFFFHYCPVSDLHRELTDEKKIEDQAFEMMKENNDIDITAIRQIALCSTRHNSELFSAEGMKDSSPSIWLFMDKPLELGEPIRATDRYFVCFLQQYRNANQLFEIDEAKPGWTHPVTLPHTLTAAMLNIARAALPKGAKTVRILDPFFGCGTTFFEALKFAGHIEFKGYDLYSPNLTAFNLNRDFLGMAANKKQLLADEVKALIAPARVEQAWTHPGAPSFAFLQPTGQSTFTLVHPLMHIRLSLGTGMALTARASIMLPTGRWSSFVRTTRREKSQSSRSRRTQFLATSTAYYMIPSTGTTMRKISSGNFRGFRSIPTSGAGPIGAKS
jgi:hypothetical protein